MTVYVSVIGDNRVVEFETPNVYLIGDTSHDSWNDQLAEQDLFTIPTDADGSFVSPAFAKNGEPPYMRTSRSRRYRLVENRIYYPEW